MHRFLLVCLLVAACSKTSSTPPPKTDAPPQGKEAAKEKSELSPLEKRLHAYGIQTGLEVAIDPTAGLTYVLYISDASGEDKRANKEGIIQVAEHLCGNAARQKLVERSRWLRNRVKEAGAVSCTGLVCTVNGMGEYDVNATYRFVEVKGNPTLRAIVETETGPITEAFRKKATAWAMEKEKSLRESTCPGK